MKPGFNPALIFAVPALLWFAGGGSLLGAPEEKKAVKRAQIQGMYKDYLAEEGFKPDLDDDGDVRFKREGKTYFIQVNEEDPEFFRLVFPNFWKIEDEADLLKVLRAADWANRKTKSCKVFMMQDNMWATIEAFLPKSDDFKPILMRCLSAMETGVSNFAQKMKEKSE